MRAHSLNAAGILGLLFPFTQALFGCEPREVSFLYTMAYIAASGNERPTPARFERLFNVRGGAEQTGSDRGLAIGPPTCRGRPLVTQIRLSTPVRKISQTGTRTWSLGQT